MFINGNNNFIAKVWYAKMLTDDFAEQLIMMIIIVLNLFCTRKSIDGFPNPICKQYLRYLSVGNSGID